MKREESQKLFAKVEKNEIKLKTFTFVRKIFHFLGRSKQKI